MSYVEILTPNVTLFRNKVLKEMVKVKLKLNEVLIQYDSCLVKRDTRMHARREKAGEDTVRRRPSASQGERPQEEPTMPAP